MASSWEMLEEETNNAYAAFRDYLMQGTKRTYARTATNTRLSMSSVEIWATNFHWKDRVRAFEQEQMKVFVGKAMDLIVHNQSEITSDMLQDYNQMIQLWRVYFIKVRDRMLAKIDTDSPDYQEEFTVGQMQKMISVRRDIDDMGRRAIGLPGTVNGKVEQSKSLPENQQLSLPSLISEEYDADDSFDNDD